LFEQLERYCIDRRSPSSEKTLGAADISVGADANHIFPTRFVAVDLLAQTLQRDVPGHFSQRRPNGFAGSVKQIEVWADSGLDNNSKIILIDFCFSSEL
jgi:hypothetical protein